MPFALRYISAAERWWAVWTNMPRINSIPDICRLPILNVFDMSSRVSFDTFACAVSKDDLMNAITSAFFADAGFSAAGFSLDSGDR